MNNNDNHCTLSHYVASFSPLDTHTWAVKELVNITLFCTSYYFENRCF